MKKQEPMAVICVQYGNYVMPVDDAAALVKILMSAEQYKEEWHRAEGLQGSYTTYHVYPQPPNATYEIKMITPDLYATAKLAGEPNHE